jgi:hypothetical protein
VPHLKPGFVVDANVLIDYANVDLTVLTVFSTSVAPIYVPDAVLEKVSALDPGDCDQLGFVVHQPTLEQLLEAGDRRGRLAYEIPSDQRHPR